jgi:hypothetical protein
LDLILRELAIACITSPLNTSFSEVKPTEARAIFGSSLTDTAHSGLVGPKQERGGGIRKCICHGTLIAARRSCESELGGSQG